MVTSAIRLCLVGGLLIGVGGVCPAAAQQAQSGSNRTVLWTVVGAAAGAGAGFLIGFHVFDDATYAERKILGATLAGGAIGGAVGFAIGRTRARPNPDMLGPVRSGRDTARRPIVSIAPATWQPVRRRWSGEYAPGVGPYTFSTFSIPSLRMPMVRDSSSSTDSRRQPALSGPEPVAAACRLIACCRSHDRCVRRGVERLVD